MENGKIIFNNISMIPKDSVEDFFVILCDDNDVRLGHVSKYSGSFVDAKCVDFIFDVCEGLNYGVDIKHTALAIFDAFMPVHVESLYKHTTDATSAGRCILKDWKTLEDKIASQLTLRILTCVQIASKIHVLPKSLSNTAVRDFLKTLGHCYSGESVLNSELRVLKTLDYKINIASPLIFIETFLFLLNLNDPSVDLKCIYDHCVYILDVLTLERDVIYRKLLESTLQSKYIDKRLIVQIRNDYVLLSATVVTTAFYVVAGFNFAEQVASLLHAIAKVPAQDITDFCSVLVTHLGIDQSIDHA